MCLTTSARRRPVVLQHVLDQVDAPARGIELVAEQHIGRAGRGAEAAMHAGAQDLVGLRDVRIGELGEGEGGLHRYTPAHIRPGLSTPFGSKLSLTRLVKRGERRVLRLEHRHRGADRGRRADQRRVAAVRADRAAHARGAAVVRSGQRRPDQAAGPVVEVLGPLPDRGRDLVPARRRDRDAPERAGAAGERHHVADRPATPRARPPARSTAISPNGLSSASSARRRCATEGATPSSRSAVIAAAGFGLDARRERRRTDAPRPTRRWTSPSRRSSRAPPPHRRARAPAPSASVSARGSTLTVTSVIAASVPQEPASTLQRS